MNKRSDPQRGSAEIPQGVRADELLPLRALLGRLGIGRKGLWQLERAGLRGASIGKQRYFLGADVLSFFRKLAEEQDRGGEAAREDSP